MTDSVSLRQDSFYEEQGITAISNNSAVVSRDQSGNVLIQPTSSLLVIEAITTNVLAESVLPLINTQFNYFKFPARTAIVDETLDLDLDLQIENTVTEIIQTYPVLPAEYEPKSDLRVTKEWTTLDFSNVIEGQPQTTTNAFTITQNLIDLSGSMKITADINSEYKSKRATANSRISLALWYEQEDGTTSYFQNDDGNLINYPSGVNNNNKVPREGIYRTLINRTLTSKEISDLGVNTTIFIKAFAEDNDEDRNHTILANGTYVKFEAV